MMEIEGVKTFLGLEDNKEGPFDIVILTVLYALTTSYRLGTALGPYSFINTSMQNELNDQLQDS